MKKLIIASLCFLFVTGIGNAQVKLPSNAQQPVNKNVPVLKNKPSVKVPVTLTQTITFTPAITRNFFPAERISGDNEFGKNELHIEFSINYAGYSGRDSVLTVQLYLYGKEWGGDGSAVRQRWSVPVYTAPPGYLISNIISEGRTTSFSFDTRDRERTKIEKYGLCNTHIYDLGRSSLGFDLRQTMLADMKFTTRNSDGPDFSTSEGGITCGFGIRSIRFNPVTIVIKKKP